MRPLIVPLVVLGLLAACQKAADKLPAADNGAIAAPTNAGPSAAAPPPAAKAIKIESKDEFLDFAYEWPAQAAAIPALDQWLRGNMESHRTRMGQMARQSAKEAKSSGYPFRGYSYDQHWSVTADTPALLVLEAEGYEYTGGAHGNPFPVTLIWDKAKDQRFATTALLDPAALARIAKPRFCKEIDAQRAQKRGAPVNPNDSDQIAEFVQCPALEKQEIVPVSRGGKALDLIRILIMPYEAGPYAEGTYTVDLPMDAALMEAVKPAWKGAFAPAG